MPDMLLFVKSLVDILAYAIGASALLLGGGALILVIGAYGFNKLCDWFEVSRVLVCYVFNKKYIDQWIKEQKEKTAKAAVLPAPAKPVAVKEKKPAHSDQDKKRFDDLNKLKQKKGGTPLR